jgi:glycolate oxidase FAD binding subunit
VTVSVSAIASKLSPIVGEESVVLPSDLAENQYAKLAQALLPAARLPCLVYPRSPAELAEVVSFAHRHHWRILPTGSGSKLDWGGLAKGAELLISTQRLNRLIDHAAGDMTVTVEAGMPLANLQTSLAAANQCVALDPSFSDRATIGGIVASRDAGSLRHRYGGVRDMCLGISFVRHDGQAVKAGGRVVKNVAGYDLMKLLTGSFGSLGIISQVTLRLYPLPIASQTVVLAGASQAIATLLSSLLASTLTPTAVDLVSPNLLAGLSGDLGLVVRFQGLAKSVNQQGDRLLKLASNLQHQTLEGAAENQYWQALHQQMEVSTGSLCQIGCLSSQAVAILMTIADSCQAQGVAWSAVVQAGGAIGKLHLQAEADQLAVVVQAARSHCQQASGFLTLLQAPQSLKTSLDVWGYTGNALAAMRKIKQQFDPDHLFSPHRFVGGL